MPRLYLYSRVDNKSRILSNPALPFPGVSEHTLFPVTCESASLGPDMVPEHFCCISTTRSILQLEDTTYKPFLYVRFSF